MSQSADAGCVEVRCELKRRCAEQNLVLSDSESFNMADRKIQSKGQRPIKAKLNKNLNWVN